eukprot:1261371-Amphidinium_carterae.1
MSHSIGVRWRQTRDRSSERSISDSVLANLSGSLISISYSWYGTLHRCIVLVCELGELEDSFAFIGL